MANDLNAAAVVWARFPGAKRAPLWRLQELALKEILLEREVLEILQWRDDAFYYASGWGATIDDDHAAVQRFRRDLISGLVVLPCSRNELRAWAERVGFSLPIGYVSTNACKGGAQPEARHRTKECQRDRKNFEQAAAAIWQHSPGLTKGAVIQRAELDQFRNRYRPKTLENWLTKVAGNPRKRGRPPSGTTIHKITK